MNSDNNFKKRIAEIKTTRWIRFTIVSLIFFAWVIWLGTWWVALFEILLFDIYITGYIPFTWWKKCKNKVVYNIMSWVDAIVYALILVYFAFAFIGQNYQIPSSSLEKTLLTGDYLFVNKMIYGPRVPMTPVYFPLVHNEMPVFNCDSYLDKPSLKYHRLKGFRKVERGDIVVFNFPAGDTITTKVNNPDYYTLLKAYGRAAVWNNKEVFGDVKYRPVDRRENYVKRCVAIAGDRIKIVDRDIYINGVKQPMPEYVQFQCYYQTKQYPLSDDVFEQLGIAKDDIHTLQTSSYDAATLSAYGITVNPDGQVPPVYVSPLTSQMMEKLRNMPQISIVRILPSRAEPGIMFPDKLADTWTCSDYGGQDGILIPAKGMKIAINDNNWTTYERAIRVYENNPTAKLQDGTLYIDGKAVKEYTFTMDYYFMMGDNRDNSLDSRYWGFVPEDHIVGSPWRVLISFDKDKSVFNGGIRWNRIFLNANPDKENYK